MKKLAGLLIIVGIISTGFDCFAKQEKCVSTITPIYNENMEHTGYSQKDNYTTRYYDDEGKQTGWQSNDQETLVDRN